MLAVGFSYYNDLESIRRSISSFINDVDYVFAIDGKYNNNPDKNDYSIDGSTEYLKQFSNVVIDNFTGFEWDKRNRYLDLCKQNKCDYLLIIDSDEYVVEADWGLFKGNMEAQISSNPNQRFFGVLFYVDESGGTSPYPRLWYRPYEVEYYNAHNIWKDKKSGSLSKSSSATAEKYLIEGVKIKMDDKLRTKEYLENTLSYQRWMMEAEKPIRKLL